MLKSFRPVYHTLLRFKYSRSDSILLFTQSVVVCVLETVLLDNGFETTRFKLIGATVEE